MGSSTREPDFASPRLAFPRRVFSMGCDGRRGFELRVRAPTGGRRGTSGMVEFAAPRMLELCTGVDALAWRRFSLSRARVRLCLELQGSSPTQPDFVRARRGASLPGDRPMNMFAAAPRSLRRSAAYTCFVKKKCKNAK